MPATFWARTDSNNAKNPALNLTGDPAIEITFEASGPDGNLLLEDNGGGIDTNTQIVIDGVTYDFTFELSGTYPTAKSDGAQQVPDQFEGEVVYLVTVYDYPEPGDTTRLAFNPDGTATQAEMDAIGNGAIDVQNLDESPEGAVCFAEGTHILTPQGETPVELLQVGDLVVTRDQGPQPIRWISRSEHRWPDSPENVLPVLISSGAFGPGTPKRDLMVSPQHRILLSDVNALPDAPDSEVLAPAKGLTVLPGVRSMKGKRSIAYYHILLQSHEILVSEGIASESFFPGPVALCMLLPTQRREVIAMFPGLKVDQENGYSAKARRFLTVKETRELARIGRGNSFRLLPGNGPAPDSNAA